MNLGRVGAAIGAGSVATYRLARAIPDRRDEAIAAWNGLFGANVCDVQLLPITGETTGSITVVVHGLMTNEVIWGFKGDRATTYGSLLARDVGTTPVFARYHTGRHIFENGRELSRCLDDLLASWPVLVTDLNLLGHSMGGLVARSACHYGVLDSRGWVSRLRRVFLLGAPHHGATMEQLAHTANLAIGLVPLRLTRVLSETVDRRSDGIKDLRRGRIVDDGWTGPPLTPSAEWFLGSACLTGDPDHPVGKFLGDILVSQFSAQGRRPGRAPENLTRERVRAFPRHGHVSLVNSPVVYEQLLTWWRSVD